MQSISKEQTYVCVVCVCLSVSVCVCVCVCVEGEHKHNAYKGAVHLDDAVLRIGKDLQLCVVRLNRRTAGQHCQRYVIHALCRVGLGCECNAMKRRTINK